MRAPGGAPSVTVKAVACPGVKESSGVEEFLRHWIDAECRIPGSLLRFRAISGLGCRYGKCVAVGGGVMKPAVFAGLATGLAIPA